MPTPDPTPAPADSGEHRYAFSDRMGLLEEFWATPDDLHESLLRTEEGNAYGLPSATAAALVAGALAGGVGERAGFRLALVGEDD